jgi:PEP-CTERM/exosortase A-associated glycosyltransferase
VKVLHVLDRSVPNVSGYASRSQYIMEFQRLMGMEPMAVTSQGQPSSATEVERIHDLDYYRTPAARGSIRKALARVRYIGERQTMRRLERRIDDVARARGVDVIHAHSPILGGIPGARVARRLGVPFVYEVRALWEDAAVDQGKIREGGPRYRITRYLETGVLRQCDTIIAICAGLKDEIVSRGIDASRVRVVPNGVDTDKFVPVERDRALAARLGIDGAVVIGFIGQFFTFEGLDVLLRAMPETLRARPDGRLLIVGGGQEAAALRQRAESLGLGGRVTFAGQVPHAEVMRYYSIMDVLVYPRLRRRITEMVTPIKPLEAMSMGKAVVASDVGGLKELVTDGITGVLFPAEDERGLARTLLTCINDPALRARLGASARASMIASRNWRTILAPYTDLYAGMVAKRTS